MPVPLVSEKQGNGESLVVFVGPSLDHHEARLIAPNAILLPPVCQGDLLSACEKYRPAVVVIIDGEFGQSLSVWHKEVLFVLDQGVRVFGASSMGALRAAELERFGMEGVGEVFRHFAGGFLTADEDVALLHASAEDDWRPLTIPLVNVLFTSRALRSSGTLDAAACDAIERAASDLHFSERSRLGLEERLRLLGRDDAEHLIGVFTENFVDQKRNDAIEALRVGMKPESRPRPPYEAPRHLFGRIGESMQSTDTLVPSAPHPLRRYQLVNDFALHDKDFERFSQRALDRAVVLEYAYEAGVEPSDDEIAAEKARFFGTLGISGDGIDDWINQNDLTPGELDRLIYDEARRRHMQRWALDVRLYERNRRIIIDQLRLENRYADAVRDASRRRQLADAHGPLPWPTETEDLIDIVRRHSKASGWRVFVDLETTASDHGFEGGAGLVTALLDATASRAEASSRRQRMARLLGLIGGRTDGQATESSDREAARRGHALVESHQATAIIVAAVQLSVFDAIGSEGSTTRQVAAACSADDSRLVRLLGALADLGFMTSLEDVWSLTPMGRLFRSDHEASLSPYVRDLAMSSVPAWQRLSEIVQGSEPSANDSSADADLAFSAVTFALDIDRGIAESIPEDLDGSVVDVGGGMGRTAQRIADRCPHASVCVVERDDVAKRARHALLGSRVKVSTAADFVGRATRVVMSRVLCTLPEELAVSLLRSVRQWCDDSSEVHVFDSVLGREPMTHSVDLFNLVRGGGGARTERQWHELASATGFELVRIDSFIGPFSQIVLRPLDLNLGRDSR